MYKATVDHPVQFHNVVRQADCLGMAMVGLIEASAAYEGIKQALGIASGIVNLKTETEINRAIIDIQRKLLDAQQAAFEDQRALDGLRREISDLNDRLSAKGDWEQERRRYVLTESPGGAFTYDLRPDASNGEIHHRLCVKCFDDGKRSILHTKAKHSGGEIVYCATCQQDLTLAKFNASARVIRNDRGFDW